VWGWLEAYHRFWEQSFDRLDECLEETQKGTQDGSPA
jgi:hypothetical protein